MNPPIWSPSRERIDNSNMAHFMSYIEKLTGRKMSTYNDLYDWSVTDIEKFWKSIWDISGIINSKGYDKILTGNKMFGAKWFVGAKLNFAENLLKYNDSNTAIISSREDAPQVKLTYSELYEFVSNVAESLKILGVRKGDRVAGFITNIPETIISMLATTSIGAIWSSCSPDFGLKGVLDRFGQIQPKILFAVEEYQYNGKKIDCREKIKRIKANIPGIEKVILIPKFFNFGGKKVPVNPINKSANYLYFSQLLNVTSGKIKFEQLPFNHPIYIMYSSGTTGAPKCIVHSAGGTLLQHFKELSLHTNLKRHDIITYYTTCGWMMWNWLVSSLSIGATIFLYDGNPAYPNLNIIWRLIEDNKITVFGTSPKYLSACQKADLIPKRDYLLFSLHTILSTGSPLSVENFQYVYDKVKSDVQLSSISGGTDIISCFMLGNPILPVYPGEIQCRGLGMKVEAFDPQGNSKLNEKGELVCTKPFPSMPVYFWNDPENKKYLSAYFKYYPNIWRHGDYIKITENGGIVVYGRSDATLNPKGVRIGTAEIYRIVDAMDEVIDSVVVGEKWNNDIRIILFVVLKKSIILNDNLIGRIKATIRNSATPRHVPYKIFQISEVPRTISGKKVEIAVSKIINGDNIDNKDALSNPRSLEQFNEILPLLSK